MLSLFDLEKLSFDELSLIYPYTGEEENLYRCYIALLLDQEGLLESSLLSVEETRDTFIKFLCGKTEDVIIDTDINFTLNRLIYVYAQTISYIVPGISANLTFKFEYDSAYLHYISRLSDDKLTEVATEFEGSTMMIMFEKEQAIRAYPKLFRIYEEMGKLQIDMSDYVSTEVGLAYLCQFARNNEALYNELYQYSLKRLNYVPILAPSRESVKNYVGPSTKVGTAIATRGLVVTIIKAVLGKSLYGHIPTENLDKILSILGEEGINCVEIYSNVKTLLMEDEKLLLIKHCPKLNEFVQRSVLVTQPERENISQARHSDLR